MTTSGLSNFSLSITGNEDINADNIYTDNLFINGVPSNVNVGTTLVSLQDQIDDIDAMIISGGSLGYWGSFWSEVTQTNLTTANAVRLNYTDPSNNAIDLDTSTGAPYTRIKVLNQATYNIQFSFQLEHTSSTNSEVYIWFAVNGTAIGSSTGKISLKNNGDHIVPAWNYILNLNANDYIQFFWYSSTSSVQLPYVAAQTISGVTIPSIPSAIITLQQVANREEAKDVIFAVTGTNTLPAGSTNYVIDTITDYGNYVNHDLTFGLARGDKGDQGDAGAVGATGPQGPQGPQGATGTGGPIGARGDTGATGPQGPQGPAGPTGPTGLQGATGQNVAVNVVTTNTLNPNEVAYVNDSIVTVGGTTTHNLTFGIPKGDAGSNGSDGSKGDKGDKGDQGDQGDQGPAGPAGSNGDATAATAASVASAASAAAAAASAATAIATANTALATANTTAAGLATTNANVTNLQGRMTIVEDKTQVLEFDLIDQIIKAPLSIQDVSSTQHVYLSNSASVGSNIDSDLELGKELIVNGNVSANENITCQENITAFGIIKARASSGNNKNVNLENNVSGTSVNFLSAITGGQQRDAGIDVTAPITNGINNKGTLSISAGQTNINSTLAISNNTTLTGNLTQTGNTTITGNLSAIGSGSMIMNSPSITIGGSGSIISIGDSVANTSITTIYGALIAPFGLSQPAGSFFSQF